MDNTKQPIPGASIVIKGKTVGTATDINGKFSLKVTEGQTLIISSVGYASQEIVATGTSTFDIVLSEDIQELSEVVVIGYGVQKKSDLTGSVSSVKADDLKSMPVARLDEALQGKAAGVQVLQNSGSPGAAAAIRIRGLGTINGGSPLIVIDGVSGGSLNSLNPNDIESMEVLKDAGSQAIYGSAGANGVIIVNTKRGKTGTMQVNLDMFYGLQQAWNTVNVCNSQQYASIYNKYLSDNGLDTYFTKDATTGLFVSPVATEVAKVGLQNTDWQNEILRTALMKNYNMSINGGNDKSTFLLSLGYNTQQGTVLRTYNDRYTMTLNSDHKVTKYIKIGQSLNVLRTQGASQAEGNEYNSPLSTAIQMLPVVPVYAFDSLGNYGTNYAYKGAGLSSNVVNPRAQIAYNNNKNISNSISGNVYTDVELFKGLTYQSRFGFNYGSSEYRQFTPTYVIGDKDDRSASQSNLSSNSYTENHSNYYGWKWSNVLTYNFSLDKHNFNVMGGTEAGYGYSYTLYTTVSNLNEYVKDLASCNYQSLTDKSKMIVGGVPFEASGYSYFGRLGYDYDGLILLQGNFRQDNTSAFSSSKRTGNFFSGSFGLKFSEFEFVKNLNIIDFGKLRLGMGSTGNSDLQKYPYLDTYGSSLNINMYPMNGSTSSNGTALLTAGNNEVSWETVNTKNIALDFGVFRNKLTFSFDYFWRTNNDMLLRKTVPLTVGYVITGAYQELGDGSLDTRPMVNYGKLNNEGFEIVVNYKDKLGDLDYDFGFNLSKAKTTVTDIGDPIYRGSGRGLSNICTTKDGGPVGAFYGYKTDGIYQESDLKWYKDAKYGTWKSVIASDNGSTVVSGLDGNGNAVSYKTTQPYAKPGDIRFKDINNDGVIDDKDKVLIGDPNPKFTFGFNANFAYKGFDLSMFFQGSYGNDIFNLLKVNLYDINNGGLNLSPDMINSYTPATYDKSKKLTNVVELTPAANTNTGLPRMAASDANQNIQRISDFYVEDGSYLRLKNIQLGYTLPNVLTSQVGINKLRVYVGAKNLLTFTNYKGFDPEVGETNGILERGLDRGTYPQSKMFLFGLNVSF